MNTLLQMGLSNALMATILAVLAAGIGRLYHRPALIHGLWLLVLLKLITPSFILYPIPWLGGPGSSANARSAADGTERRVAMASAWEGEHREDTRPLEDG